MVSRPTVVATLAQVLGVSSRMAASASLVSFSLVVVAGTVAENKQMWSMREVFALGVVSVLIGIAILIGTMFMLYTTVKLADLPVTRIRSKKKD